MRPKGSATELEARRRRAIELLDKGMTPTQVSASIGVARQTVQKWKAWVRDGGKRALKAVPQHVKTCRLSPDQQKELGKIIEAGAAAAGFETDLWTTARLAEVIEKKFKITYNADHLGRLLRSIGFSCQKPTKRAREQNEREVKQWRKQDWPRIKKGRRIEC
jgi:transposase